MQKLLLLLLFFTSLTSAQETVYISDVLYVPLRSGQGIEYRIINAAMKSGTQLTRLEQSEDGAWSKVVTESGTEGWIRNQYLVEEMTSLLRLNQALTRLARIEKENADYKALNDDLTKKFSSLTNTSQQETQAKNKLADELERVKQLSAGAINLDRNYKELLEKYEVTKTSNDSLKAENEKLKNDKNLSFMLYGAGILVLGMILAVILPSLKPKKSYSEWR